MFVVGLAVSHAPKDRKGSRRISLRSMANPTWGAVGTVSRTGAATPFPAARKGTGSKRRDPPDPVRVHAGALDPAHAANYHQEQTGFG